MNLCGADPVSCLAYPAADSRSGIPRCSAAAVQHARGRKFTVTRCWQNRKLNRLKRNDDQVEMTPCVPPVEATLLHRQDETGSRLYCRTGIWDNLQKQNTT